MFLEEGNRKLKKLKRKRKLNQNRALQMLQPFNEIGEKEYPMNKKRRLIQVRKYIRFRFSTNKQFITCQAYTRITDCWYVWKKGVLGRFSQRVISNWCLLTFAVLGTSYTQTWWWRFGIFLRFFGYFSFWRLIMWSFSIFLQSIHFLNFGYKLIKNLSWFRLCPS